MEQKVRGLLAYIFGWLGGLIVLFAFKDNTKETNKNACQAIVASVSYIALSFVVNFISGVIQGIFSAMKAGFVGSIIGLILSLLVGAVSIAYLVFVIFGAIKAYKEQDYNVPVITGLTEKIFKSKLA